MHEELYTVLRLADLSMLETAEFKPGGAPIDPGELKYICWAEFADGPSLQTRTDFCRLGPPGPCLQTKSMICTLGAK